MMRRCHKCGAEYDEATAELENARSELHLAELECDHELFRRSMLEYKLMYENAIKAKDDVARVWSLRYSVMQIECENANKRVKQLEDEINQLRISSESERLWREIDAQDCNMAQDAVCAQVLPL